MKVVIQRATRGAVHVNESPVGTCDAGLVLLIGFGADDDETSLASMASKIANMRIFPDEGGRFHHSLLDVEGGALCIPQFTLYADTSKGRRPEFFGAKNPQEASKLFELFIEELKTVGISRVESGVFGAYMQVELVNDGPVTILLES